MSTPRSLLDKIWDQHVVCAPEGEQALIYIDLHLVHEVNRNQNYFKKQIDCYPLPQATAGYLPPFWIA